MMKKIKWTALLLSALLMLSLFAACDGDGDATPSPSGSPTDVPPSDYPPSQTPPDAPTPFKPVETLVYPDLMGFEKTIGDRGATYSAIAGETMAAVIMVSFEPGSAEQLAEIEQGTWGPALEAYFDEMMLLNIGELKSSQNINLPGLNRKALELDITWTDGSLTAKGLLIPSDDQIVSVTAYGPPAHQQVLQDGYDEFVQELKAE